MNESSEKGFRYELRGEDLPWVAARWKDNSLWARIKRKFPRIFGETKEVPFMYSKVIKMYWVYIYFDNTQLYKSIHPFCQGNATRHAKRVLKAIKKG